MAKTLPRQHSRLLSDRFQPTGVGVTSGYSLTQLSLVETVPFTVAHKQGFLHLEQYSSKLALSSLHQNPPSASLGRKEPDAVISISKVWPILLLECNVYLGVTDRGLSKCLLLFLCNGNFGDPQVQTGSGLRYIEELLHLLPTMSRLSIRWAFSSSG